MNKVGSVVLLLSVCVLYAQFDSTQLLFPGDLVYQGAFKLENLSANGTALAYSSGEIAYNPAGNGGHGSLFITSHVYQQWVGEFAIAEPVKTKNTQLLNTGAALQSWTDITSGKKDAYASAVLGMDMTSLFVYDSLLFFSLYKHYNVDGQNLFTQGASKLDFKNLDTKGMWHIGKPGDYLMDWTCGYMTEIPEQWRTKFGYPILAGNCGTNNAALTSAGPGFFGFNPFEFGSLPADSAVFSTKQFLFYPYSKKSEFTFMIDSTVVTPYTDRLSTWLMRDRTLGAVFPMTTQGRSSLITFNVIGTYTPDFYGFPGDFPVKEVNICAGSSEKGPHDPPYYIAAWFYNPDDLLKVAKGEIDPWKVHPYATVNMKDDFFSECVPAGSVAFDKVNGRVFITEKSDIEGYDVNPLIHVYKIKNNAVSTAARSASGPNRTIRLFDSRLQANQPAVAKFYNVNGKLLRRIRFIAGNDYLIESSLKQFSGIHCYEIQSGGKTFRGTVGKIR